MARKRKEKEGADVKLAHPDRSAPSKQTLLQLAQERDLFAQAEEKQRANNRRKGIPEAAEEDQGKLSPTVERIFETTLWCMSLATLHFTLDVLVQHQYAVQVVWVAIVQRAATAFLVFCLLFWTLHKHASNPTLLPYLPASYQQPLRQSLFCVISTIAGCYLVHITNRHGYLAVMKQAPPLGCLWIWSVIELDLIPAALSLGSVAIFLYCGDYTIR